MACKAVFYLKATALLLTLAVSSLVGCGGSSFSAADLSDSGVTPDVTGGQSSVISSQSSVRTSTGGQLAVSSQTSVISQTGGTSAVSSQSSVISQTGGTSSISSIIIYGASYSNGSYLGGSILPKSVSVGECTTDLVRTDCICTLGGTNSFSAFNNSCSDGTLSECITKSTCPNLKCDMYSYTWQCGPKPLSNGTGGTAAFVVAGGTTSIVATGGSVAIAATGGSATIAATGGGSSIAPSTYTVTYLNQVASQSAQAPGTCPSGQTVTTCTCVISGMQSTLTSCNPTACQIENSKQYPQSIFTWSCV